MIAKALLWCLELHHRWPAIIGILRGKTVIYQAECGPPETALVNLWNPNGSVIMDSRLYGSGSYTAIHAELSGLGEAGDETDTPS